jgi:hypothetical protein
MALVINVLHAGQTANWPGAVSGNERHYNNPAEAAGPAVAVNVGSTLDAYLKDTGGNGAYGDGSGGRWRLYTGTGPGTGGVLLADTGFKAGYFGLAHYGGVVPAGHTHCWIVVLNNIWYEEVYVDEALAVPKGRTGRVVRQAVSRAAVM